MTDTNGSTQTSKDEGYTVFARRYRPQTFEEMVGQEHVAKTLRAAIESGRVAHAFLFTGVRGVGKTTTARLLAKALCCEQGPTPTPCNVCDACVEIAQGTSLDVQEIDGASNNSVDDVRRLQETLPFRPAKERFKIIIVDEVHMLSTGAFNAFLKTLEEPPPHVKFIFATTESHRIPITIRSRCQRYDFRLIPQRVIAEKVREVLASDSLEADEEAIEIISREASGSMRDAFTLLDQLVATGSNKLEGASIARHLGLSSLGSIRALMKAMLEGDPKAILLSLRDALGRGASPLLLSRQLTQHVRDLVVLATTGETALVEMGEEAANDALSLAKSVSPLLLQRSFAGLAKLVDEVAHANSPEMILEMGLIRLASLPDLMPMRALLDRLEKLEAALGGGTGGGGTGGGGAKRGGSPGGSSQGGSGARRMQAAAAPEAKPAHTRGASEAAKDATNETVKEATSETANAPAQAFSTPQSPKVEAPKVTTPTVKTAASSTPDGAPPAPARPGPREPVHATDLQRTEEGRRKPPAQTASRFQGPPSAPMDEPDMSFMLEPEEHGFGGFERGPEPRDPRGAAPRSREQRSPREGRREPGRHAQPGRPEPRREDRGDSHEKRGRTHERPAQMRERQSQYPATRDGRAQSHPPRREPASEPAPRPARGAPPALRRAAILEWEKIVGALREGKPALAAVLEHAFPRVVDAENIVIAFPKDSFYGRQADSSASKEAIGDAASRVFGKRPSVLVRFDAEAGGSRTVAEIETSRRKQEQSSRRRDALAHPLVQAALDVFPEARSSVRVQLED